MAMPVPVSSARDSRTAYLDAQQSQVAGIERVPWSVLGPEFAQIWGRNDPSDPQPEHMEVVGINGGGKTWFICTILQERMIVRNTPEILILTKPADATVLRLGYPIVDDIQGVKKHRQCIFWPRTTKMGAERKTYQEAKIRELLDFCWVPNSNRIINFDEIAYIESLSADIRSDIEMYWREARSQGITIVAGKQRPQGTNRHMHSETKWTVAFVPADESDKERFAELFGPKRVWLPVFETMDPEKREFIIRHTITRQTYISWVDTPLVPVENPHEQRGGATRLY